MAGPAGAGKPGPCTRLYLTPTDSDRGSCRRRRVSPGPSATAETVAAFRRQGTAQGSPEGQMDGAGDGLDLITGQYGRSSFVSSAGEEPVARKGTQVLPGASRPVTVRPGPGGGAPHRQSPKDGRAAALSPATVSTRRWHLSPPWSAACVRAAPAAYGAVGGEGMAGRAVAGMVRARPGRSRAGRARVPWWCRRGSRPAGRSRVPRGCRGCV